MCYIRNMAEEPTLRFQGMMRGLVLTLFCWRVVVVFPQVGNGLLDASIHGGASIGWLGLTLVLDLVCLWLLIQPEATMGTVASGVVWFSISITTGPFAELGFLSFQGQFLYLALAILFCWSAGWIFNRMRIRGKLFLVCLASAALPMLLLTLALRNQFRSMVDHSLVEVSQELLQPEIFRLEAFLQNELAGTLNRLTDRAFPPIVPLATEAREVLLRNIRESGLVLRRMVEIPLEPRETCLSLDFRGILASDILRMLAQKTRKSYIAPAEIEGDRVITIRVTNEPVSRIIEQIRQTTGMRIQQTSTHLILGGMAPPETPSSGVGEGSGKGPPASSTLESGNASETAATEMVRLRERCGQLSSSTFGCALRIDGAGEPQTLQILLPFFGNSQADQPAASATSSPSDPVASDTHAATVGGILLEFDHDAWFRTRIPAFAFPASLSPRLLYPVLPQTIRDCFPSFRGHQEILRTFPRPSRLDALWTLPVGRVTGDQLIRGKRRHKLVAVSCRIFSPDSEEWILLGWSIDPFLSGVVGGLPVSQVEWFLVKKQMQTVWLAVLAVLFAGAMSLVYSRQLSGPLVQITVAARRIKDGDLDASLPAEAGDDEIQELAETLSRMAEQLKGRITLANRQLLAEKGKLEALVESTREGILLISDAGRILYANPAARQWLERASFDDPFLTILKTVGTGFKPEMPAVWDGTMKEWFTVFELSRPVQGERKTLSLYLRNLGKPSDPTTDGGHPGFLGVFRDITVEKAIDRMKTEFVSLVSHELRTPLTSIKAFTEMILDGEVPEAAQQKEYLGIVNEEAERLTRLINELLDLARIESGRRPLKREIVDLVGLTREIIRLLASEAEEKRLTIIFEPEGPRVEASLDADLAKQLGLNLLSNAVKYTPAGGQVTVGLRQNPDRTVTWRFSDTGIGLTQVEQERLFSKFFRSDSEVVRSIRGTGLGLALVKQIVDSHEGLIQVESQFGKGSTFTVIF